jgi:hypothetical protein
VEVANNLKLSTYLKVIQALATKKIRQQILKNPLLFG